MKFLSSAVDVDDPVYLVGIRGYYLNSMGKPAVNDIGIYDDAIILIAPGVIKTFNANTDPSRHKDGVATLLPGVHYYKKGKHGISKPGGGYPALRPATSDESLPVSRTGRKGVFKGIAINIHKGGYNTTSSEGCQTIYPTQWEDFITSVYAEMDKAKQKTIAYILVENY